MTKRERKYHFGKRIQRKIKALKSVFRPELKTFKHFFPNGTEVVTRRPFLHMDNEGLIHESAVAGEPVTITITKYNLARNSSLQKGQLN